MTRTTITDQDDDGFMRPLWVKYPNLRRGSMGWRMGPGEAYWEDFIVWWSCQPESIRLALRSKYPAPEEWSDFWLRHSRP